MTVEEAIEIVVEKVTHAKEAKRMADRLGLEFHTLWDFNEFHTGVFLAMEGYEFPMSHRYLLRRLGDLGAIAYRLAHDF